MPVVEKCGAALCGTPVSRSRLWGRPGAGCLGLYRLLEIDVCSIIRMVRSIGNGTVSVDMTIRVVFDNKKLSRNG